MASSSDIEASSVSGPSRRAKRIHWLYQRVGRRFRQRRLEAFRAEFPELRNTEVLDVGGSPLTWFDDQLSPEVVVLLNIQHAHHAESAGLVFVNGDARRLPFPDRAYPVVFSNSVIEHVGSFEDQVMFAKEIRRVAHGYWVQTPAWVCPVEPHYLMPFAHWLPHAVQRRTLRWASIWGWITRPTQKEIDRLVAETRLLKRREIGLLFPDAEIITERIMYLIPKSYIAVRHCA